MSLADAQSLAIRKLLSKSAYDSNIAPGPPLPESHPSPILLAKIHLECASLYSSALSLAKTSAPSKGKDTGDGDVRTDLQRYLSDETSFHNALARKWLGIDAGENGKGDKGGEAVGFLAWAKKDLEELKDGGKRRKEKVADELQTVTVFWKHYKKVNDSLTFQPIPPQPDLQARIPAGRLALPAKPFNPPLPIFGPGSIEYARQKAEELELPDESPASTLTSPPEAAGKSYAGAGSYF
ncbi:BRO1 domain-containing protein [Salix suchowensis]|nr:BRO1 domain-containing protein [Salix suchowensis]